MRAKNTLSMTSMKSEIAERKRVEKAFKESEERFKSLSENAPVIIYEANTEGAFMYVNSTFEEILGYAREEVIGKYFVEFAKEKDKKTYRHLFKQVRDNKKTVRNESGVLLCKDGSSRLFDFSASPNFDSHGNVKGVVGIIVDITEQRKLEEQIQKVQRLESLGTLAGGFAHNFNNILMGLQGRVSLMQIKTPPSHPHYIHLTRMEEYISNAKILTRQILDFASGGKYEFKPLNLNELTKNQAKMFACAKREITLHEEYEENLWAVEVDKGQIEQALLNLFVNAVDAMQGGGDLFLKTENTTRDHMKGKMYRPKPGKYVLLKVTDTGVGMGKETQRHIFEPFFTTKEMSKGTGLGLASVYGIVKAHGGYIDVKSKIGHGTTFNIYLPVSEKEIIPEVEASEGVSNDVKTILLVDDEEMIIEVTDEMLKTLGYKVLSSRSGQEAIEIYKKNQKEIDIVLLDMIMPYMGGGEVFDRLKGINPNVKVILSSGYSISGHAARIIQRGCNGFLQKPFKMEQLSQKIRDVLVRNSGIPVS